MRTAISLLRGVKKVVCFSGAGLSAESGVPTFRDAQAVGGALWSKYDPMTLASPAGFQADAHAVIEWYNWRRRTIADALPNDAHRALAQAERSTARSFHNVTQNVDDLLERAGALNVIHLHGSIAVDHCERRCGQSEPIDMHNPPGLRECAACGNGARMRPGVVWFGETLPADAWSEAERVCRACDVLLVVGTSAVVYPAAGLVALAKSCGAKIIVVNTQSNEASHLADAEVIGNAGEVLPRLLG
jgi:NAD-dependent deacetylase